MRSTVPSSTAKKNELNLRRISSHRMHYGAMRPWGKRAAVTLIDAEKKRHDP